MPAYVIFTREKTRNAAEIEQYKQLTPASFAGFNPTFRVTHGRYEVLEGPPTETVMMIEFPTYEEAMAWYASPAYQKASEHRFLGADYRCIIVEGV